VLGEPNIAAGDCRIEWADGGVNRDAGAADRVIGEAVARYITARRSFADELRRGGETGMSDDGKVPLPNLEDRAVQPDMPIAPEPDGPTSRVAGDLEAVFDVPVQVSAVLGRARMEINDLLKIGPGTVLELDRRSARRSTSMSTTAWSPAARPFWSKRSSA
jgi:flagellar motor switch/type III secretory pathway protein FliN